MERQTVTLLSIVFAVMFARLHCIVAVLLHLKVFYAMFAKDLYLQTCKLLLAGLQIAEI